MCVGPQCAGPGVQVSVCILQTRVYLGPVTMIVPASGYQIRCIPWVQMDTFNKGVGFYVD